MKLPRLEWFSTLVGSACVFPYSLRDAFNLCYQFNRVKWFVQRGLRGYSDDDLGDFGPYLAGVAAKGLTAFRKIPDRGVPGGMWGGWGVMFGSVLPDNPDKRWLDTRAKWDDILRQMAEGFEAGAYDIDGDEQRKQSWNRALDLAKDWLLCVWD